MRDKKRFDIEEVKFAGRNLIAVSYPSVESLEYVYFKIDKYVVGVYSFSEKRYFYSENKEENCFTDIIRSFKLTN